MKFFIHENASENIVCDMASILFRGGQLIATRVTRTSFLWHVHHDTVAHMHHILECLIPLPGYRGLPPSRFPRSRPGVHIVQSSQDFMGGIQWRASIGEVGGGICRGCCRRCMCGGRWGGFQLRAYNGCTYPPGTSRTATSRCASHRSRGPLWTTSAIFVIQNGRQERRRVCRWFRVWGSKVRSFSRAFGATRRAFDITVGVLIASSLLPSCARVLGRVLACRRLDLVLQLSLHITLCQEGVLDRSPWGRLFFLEDCIWFLSTFVRQWIDADIGGLADFLLKETTTHDDVIKWKHSPRYLAICAENSLVTGEFPSQRPATRSLDVFFHLPLNKRLNKQSRGWLFETPSRPLWRHCNAGIMEKFWWSRPCVTESSIMRWNHTGHYRHTEDQ